MSESSTIALVQNPAFGATLLWHFGHGYQLEGIGYRAPLPVLFLVLPLLLHGQTLEAIRSTNLPSGLTKLASKMAERRERLISVHDRALRMRDLTLRSLAIGAGAGLLSIEYESALVRANEVDLPTPPHRLRFHVSGAQKIGRWFARLPSGQVFNLLQVTV